MKSYELSYLITPEISDSEVKNFQEKIIAFVQEKGVLVDTRLAKKIGLAYPIKKRVSAFFATLGFQSKTEDLSELEKKIKAEPNVIRYLILGKITHKAKKKRSRPPVAPSIIRKIEEPKKEKAKLEEIEQKLEEVLGKTQ